LTRSSWATSSTVRSFTGALFLSTVL